MLAGSVVVTKSTARPFWSRSSRHVRRCCWFRRGNNSGACWTAASDAVGDADAAALPPSSSRSFFGTLAATTSTSTSTTAIGAHAAAAGAVPNFCTSVATVVPRPREHQSATLLSSFYRPYTGGSCGFGRTSSADESSPIVQWLRQITNAWAISPSATATTAAVSLFRPTGCAYAVEDDDHGVEDYRSPSSLLTKTPVSSTLKAVLASAMACATFRCGSVGAEREVAAVTAAAAARAGASSGIPTTDENFPLPLRSAIWHMSSTLKKRRAKMNKHKLRKRRKLLRRKAKK